MKSILTLSALLAFSGLSYGQSDESEKGHAVVTECASKTVTVAAQGECPKGVCASKTKAITVAAKGECASKCHANAKTVSLVVAGLENQTVSAKAHAAIAGLKGPQIKKACAGSGCFAMNYDASKFQEAELIKVLTDSGLTIKEQQVSFKVTGMTCGGCSHSLTKTLAKTEGVVGVGNICHTSGHTVVTFDPAKTTVEKVENAINATKYKVAKAPKKAAQPQS